MPTKNPRLQVVLEKPLYEALASLAKGDHVSMSTKARDLIKEAIEHLEDLGLASIVADRAAKPEKLLSRKELERRLDR
ncbi:MAG: antitoxin, RHH family protein [Elusimicrobiota bacterium]